MKVSIGSKVMDGPYGGGNTFLINLIEYLERLNHTVVHNLDDKDIDLILLTSPLPDSEHSTFNHLDVLKYLRSKNDKTLVVQRFNECDERKGTRGINRKLLKANISADYSVFVSKWLQDIFESFGMTNMNKKTILGGSDIKIFNQDNKNIWNKNKKFKIVTHHWSSNWMKGFDVYQKLDLLLNNKEVANKISFTYIGNLPKGFSFVNANTFPPLASIELSKKLKDFDGYITGSINEPSGNHHVEGALSGLPLLYINSGGIPEYCHGYGVEFSIDNLEDKIFELMNNYQLYYEKLKYYNFTSDKTSQEYVDLFEHLIGNKEDYIMSRKTISYLNLLLLSAEQFYYRVNIFFIRVSNFIIKRFR